MSADLENYYKNVCSNQASSSNLTLEYWQLTDDYFLHGKVVATIISLYILVGLPWNILVLTAIIREKLYKEPTVILLLNLLATDILSLLISFIYVVTGFAGEYVIGSSDKVRCETCHIFMVITLLYSSMFTIAVMSLDRFLYIYMPFKYERLVTPHSMILAVTIVLIISISVGFTLRFYPAKVIFYRSLMNCSPDIPQPVFVVIFFLGYIALSVILIFNVWLAYIALRNVRRVYIADSSTGTTRSALCCSAICTVSTRSEKQNRVFFVVCSLILPCLISWTPFILSLLPEIRSDTPVDYPLYLSTVIVLMFNIQAVVHPIVETVLIPDVRKSMKKTARYLWKKNEDKECNS